MSPFYTVKKISASELQFPSQSLCRSWCEMRKHNICNSARTETGLVSFWPAKELCVNIVDGRRPHRNTFAFMAVITTVFSKHTETSWISFSSPLAQASCVVALIHCKCIKTVKASGLFAVIGWEYRNRFISPKNALDSTRFLLFFILIAL